MGRRPPGMLMTSAFAFVGLLAFLVHAVLVLVVWTVAGGVGGIFRHGLHDVDRPGVDVRRRTCGSQSGEFDVLGGVSSIAG
jgi:hypothetical protein